MNINFFKKLFSKNKPYKIAETLECGFLNVDEKHKVYYETAGNPAGIPVVVLHGGPGGELSHSKRQYLNPKKYYIIQFDQRGCGQSTPKLGLKNNNTEALLTDIEKLRTHLCIKKWVVFGASWGSTLAIAYAMMCKDKTLGLLLNGLFLTSKQELDRVFSPKGVAAQIFPDQFVKFTAPLTKTEAKNPLKSYIAKLEKVEGIEKQLLLRSYSLWTWTLCMLNSDLKFIDEEVARDDFDTSSAEFELYYAANNFFIDSDELAKNLNYLSDIPVYMVQGRYDLLTNPITAYNISKEIENSKLVFTLDGHVIIKGMQEIINSADEMLITLEDKNSV